MKRYDQAQESVALTEKSVVFAQNESHDQFIVEGRRRPQDDARRLTDVNKN
jgi:hypothetical protein